MKVIKIILIFFLIQQCCIGQTYFNNYYKTGYNNLLSCNVITTADSGYVFVNYISDSVTHRQDFGLIKIDKSGNEVNKKSFNMFDQDYSAFLQGMKQFIPATNCSYFLTGGTSDINDRTAIFLNKINRLSLDTMITKFYGDTAYTLNMNNFIKFNSNKYLLIGEKSNSITTRPFILEIDSNLNVLHEKDVYNPTNFGLFNAIYNPDNKQILLEGVYGTLINGNQPLVLMHIDTLGNPINAVIVTAPVGSANGYSQIFYSQSDHSYVAIGCKQIGVFGNYPMFSISITKFKDDLTPLWQKSYGEGVVLNEIGDAVILADGSIVASGRYSTTQLGSEDAAGVILKTDINGNLQWFREYNNLITGAYPKQYWEEFYSIDTTREGGYILCGNVMNQPKAKAWAVKTDGNGCVTPGCASSSITVQDFATTTQTVDVTAPLTSTTGIATNIFNAASVSIYPNPASNQLNIEMTAHTTATQIKLLDVTGKPVLIQPCKGNCTLDITGVQNGLYLVNVYSKAILLCVKKIVVNK